MCGWPPACKDFRRDQITALEAEQQHISVQAQKCHATAELFGFDLLAECVLDTVPARAPAPAVTTPPPPTSVPAKTVKDHVRDIAQQAHPNSVRASQIRKQLEGFGIVVHEKTVGTTLYRLSREHVIRREGKADWFFVPEGERPTAAAPQGEESPGVSPGCC